MAGFSSLCCIFNSVCLHTSILSYVSGMNILVLMKKDNRLLSPDTKKKWIISSLLKAGLYFLSHFQSRLSSDSYLSYSLQHLNFSPTCTFLLKILLYPPFTGHHHCKIIKFTFKNNVRKQKCLKMTSHTKLSRLVSINDSFA